MYFQNTSYPGLLHYLQVAYTLLKYNLKKVNKFLFHLIDILSEKPSKPYKFVSLPLQSSLISKFIFNTTALGFLLVTLTLELNTLLLGFKIISGSKYLSLVFTPIISTLIFYLSVSLSDKKDKKVNLVYHYIICVLITCGFLFSYSLLINWLNTIEVTKLHGWTKCSLENILAFISCLKIMPSIDWIQDVKGLKVPMGVSYEAKYPLTNDLNLMEAHNTTSSSSGPDQKKVIDFSEFERTKECAEYEAKLAGWKTRKQEKSVELKICTDAYIGAKGLLENVGISIWSPNNIDSFVQKERYISRLKEENKYLDHLINGETVDGVTGRGTRLTTNPNKQQAGSCWAQGPEFKRLKDCTPLQARAQRYWLSETIHDSMPSTVDATKPSTLPESGFKFLRDLIKEDPKFKKINPDILGSEEKPKFRITASQKLRESLAKDTGWNPDLKDEKVKYTAWPKGFRKD